MQQYNIKIGAKPAKSSIIISTSSSAKLSDEHLSKVFSKEEIKQLQQIAKLAKFEGKPKTSIQANFTGLPAIIIGNDKAEIEQSASYLATTLSSLVKEYKSQNINIILNELDAQNLHQIVVAWHKANYNVHDRHDLKKEFKKDKSSAKTVNLEITVFNQNNKDELSSQLLNSLATVEGMVITQDLANLPPNIATPTFLANTAKDIANKDNNISVKILDKKQIEALGMNSFLSVTRGSQEAPKLITLEYKPKTTAKAKKTDNAPIILVGKGITFDSGGISLKPGEGMDEMKYDMCGAATVIGVFKALALIQPQAHVIGIIPSCENMPSGTATRPGDIVKSMNGLTIEILNTDAEGRLILCDALTYAQKISPQKPKAIIDIATLTGACVIALGNHNTGLFCNNQNLQQQLLSSAKSTLDNAWAMPLDSAYKEQLKSNFADLANIGGRPAGSVTAACFLQHFIDEGNAWAHLDIAGTAWNSGKNKGATGRPVSLLIDFIVKQ
ncbi:MAG: hypothetical protein RLZZ210_1846 [Pseudomonadota bacterium]|jgi:leucyl aminopeptidase